jgi:hypothetical protein
MTPRKKRKLAASIRKKDSVFLMKRKFSRKQFGDAGLAITGGPGKWRWK